MATVQTGSVLERAVLKEGQIFLVTDRAGDIKALNLEGHGLYYRDTRHLSLFEMDISGTRLSLLSAAGELNFMSNLQFANDTLLGQNGEVLAEPRTISIRRNRFLHGGLHERLGFVNYNQHPVNATVRLTFGSDFRDMFEVRGYYQNDGHGLGDLLPLEIDADGILLAYQGQDGIERRTRITFNPRPSSIEVVHDRLRRLDSSIVGDGVPGSEAWIDPRAEGWVMPPIAAAVFDLELLPKESRSITLEIVPSEANHTTISHGSLDNAFVGMRDSYARWRADATSFETDHDLFDQLLRRALHDLRRGRASLERPQSATSDDALR